MKLAILENGKLWSLSQMEYAACSMAPMIIYVVLETAYVKGSKKPMKCAGTAFIYLPHNISNFLIM